MTAIFGIVRFILIEKRNIDEDKIASDVQLMLDILYILTFYYTLKISILLTPGNDRGVTPHSIDQSNQFRSRALRSIEHERVHDFHSK